jgi:putative transposase
VCAPHAPWPVDPFRDRLQTVDAVAPSSSAGAAEISAALLVQGADEAGPQGAQPGSRGRRRRHETAEPELGAPRIAQQVTLAFGLPINKDVGRRVLAARYTPKPDSAGPSWLTVLGHAKDSLWSLDLFRCESATLRTHWVLVVMEQCTRPVVGFGVHRGVVDGVALCHMFNRAIGRQPTPTYLSSDHDPLYRYHQWQANLRILEVEAIKTVPYAPLSHPFVERLIGTIRRECLDRTFCSGRPLIWRRSSLSSNDTSTVIARTRG